MTDIITRLGLGEFNPRKWHKEAMKNLCYNCTYACTGNHCTPWEQLLQAAYNAGKAAEREEAMPTKGVAGETITAHLSQCPRCRKVHGGLGAHPVECDCGERL